MEKIISNNAEWKRTVLHDRENPKGFDILPEKADLKHEKIVECIGTENYEVLELDHANCVAIFDPEANKNFLNISPTMFVMAFASKKAKMIYGNCIISNAGYLK